MHFKRKETDLSIYPTLQTQHCCNLLHFKLTAKARKSWTVLKFLSTFKKNRKTTFSWMTNRLWCTLYIWGCLLDNNTQCAFVGLQTFAGPAGKQTCEVFISHLSKYLQSKMKLKNVSFCWETTTSHTVITKLFLKAWHTSHKINKKILFLLYYIFKHSQRALAFFLYVYINYLFFLNSFICYCSKN